MKDEFFYLECSCSSPEHTVRFIRDEEFTYMTFFLSEGPWYSRLAKAVKYVFGYKCRYGHFDEVVLGKNEVAELIRVLSENK